MPGTVPQEQHPGLMNNAIGHANEARRMLLNTAKLVDEAERPDLHREVMARIDSVDDLLNALGPLQPPYPGFRPDRIADDRRDDLMADADRSDYR